MSEAYPFETQRIIISFPDEKGGKTVIDMYVKKDKRSAFEIALDALEEFKDVKGPVKVSIHLGGRRWQKYQGSIQSIIDKLRQKEG